MLKPYDKLKLANPGTWQGFGCDIDAVFTVFNTCDNGDFGSGQGVMVRPAIQPQHPLGATVWYDAAHFVALPDNVTKTLDKDLK